jgi:hypothetical protein
VSPEGNATIQIVSPSESDTIGAAPLILAWHSAGSNAVYRVLLMDAAGGVRWTANTEDTTAILPDSVALTSGEAFFWSVDALLAGGRSATTRVQTFIVR